MAVNAVEFEFFNSPITFIYKFRVLSDEHMLSRENKFIFNWLIRRTRELFPRAFTLRYVKSKFNVSESQRKQMPCEI